jgi:GNAT superfamily N-acetyltransferase
MYTIRTAQLEDMGFIITLAEQEGWNPGLNDAQAFHATDSEGFYIGVLDGEPIGCISAVDYHGFGFIGLYIVKEKYRGKGYGLALWKHAVERLRSGIIGLDGVVSQQSNYQKSNFNYAYPSHRFCWKPNADLKLGEDGFYENNIVPESKVAFAALCAYDYDCFRYARPEFLRVWTSMPTSKTFVSMDKNAIQGYATLRLCHQGFKLGPLFADTPSIARNLLLAAGYEAQGNPIFLDVPEPNREAGELAVEFGMHKVFETARMYANGVPDLPIERIYGVTTFELG